MKTIVLLVSLFLVGCSTSAGRKPFTAQGWVRDVRGLGRSNIGSVVVFEGDDGSVFAIQLLENAPVWKGMHAVIQYELDTDYACDCWYKNFKVVKRLPE